MNQVTSRIIYVIFAFLFLAGVATSAPIGRDIFELSSVDTSGLVSLSHAAVGGGVGVGPWEKHDGLDAWDDYDELVERAWVEDGSEMVVLERRGFLDFFRNLGRKIKEGFQTVGRKIKEGFQTAGRKIKEGFQTAGKKIKEGFQTAGKKIKEGFQTAGKKIKEGFQTAGRKMKEGFQKAGQWIKTTGAKVAKFGLKVIATAQAVAAHVVRFIPVIGQAASTALKASSFGLNKASEAIHVSLGDKLDKGMKVMDIIQDPIGALAHKAAHEASHAIQRHQAAAHPGSHPAPPHHSSSSSRSGGGGKGGKGIAGMALRVAGHAASHVAQQHISLPHHDSHAQRGAPHAAAPAHHSVPGIHNAVHNAVHHASAPVHHDVHAHVTAPHHEAPHHNAPPVHHAAASPPHHAAAPVHHAAAAPPHHAAAPAHHAAPPPPHHAAPPAHHAAPPPPHHAAAPAHHHRRR